MESVTAFKNLASSDLIVDRIYASGIAGNVSDDPLSKMFPGVGNLGGFRLANPSKKQRYLVLYTSGSDPDWPDRFDPYSGRFTYYGDNRSSGKSLHATPHKGNALLAEIFGMASEGKAKRKTIPPIFIFEKSTSGAHGFRSAKFLGLAVPGSSNIDDDLIAIWRSTKGHRFQNYRATFTVLDEGSISRLWIKELASGKAFGSHCPPAWKSWVDSGELKPLIAPPTVIHRSKQEQIAASPQDKKLVRTIYEQFRDTPTDFEPCAAELFRMLEPNTSQLTVTQPSKDGGRDAVGTYSIGPVADLVNFEFALEAKCYGPSNSVGVKELARLISRLRHRQFGVLVTTSWVSVQVYKEIREDEHPIVIIAENDIASILKSAGISTPEKVKLWLKIFASK